MNYRIIIFFIVLVLLIAFYFGYLRNDFQSSRVNNTYMEITSSAFLNNQSIPYQYTCDGKNVNPPLSINQVQAKVKSLVLVVSDSDVPLGDWTHWLVWNITPTTREINEDQLPAGAIEGKNDFGKIGWGGPCPPQGVHHYQFKLYAIDIVLNLSAGSKKEDLEKVMKNHILYEAVLVGLYKR